MARPCITSKLSSAINSGGTCQLVGFEEEAVLIPLSYITKSTLAFESGELVCTVMAKSSPGFKVTIKGDLPFKDTKTDGKMGTYQQMFDNDFMFAILENSPAASKQIKELGNDHYVAVLQAKSYDAAKKNKYIIVGLNRGLYLSAATFANDSQENFGWRVTMKEVEGLNPMYYFWPSGGESAADSWFAGLIS